MGLLHNLGLGDMLKSLLGQAQSSALPALINAVLAKTQYHDLNGLVAALQKGAKHFVQKPVKPEVLYEILRYVLGDDPNAAGAPVELAGEQRS